MTEYDPNATISIPTSAATRPPGPPGWTEPELGGSGVDYHPIRGALWGALLGIGVAIWLVLLRVIDLDLALMGVVVLVGAALGALWGRFGPPKR